MCMHHSNSASMSCPWAQVVHTALPCNNCCAIKNGSRHFCTSCMRACSEPAEVAGAQAAILDVPFVDVVTDMSDPSLPLTTMEYDEW